jgi:hypothetical protein
MTSDAPERRREFCAGLKTERERRGTPLTAIADATKVKTSLLEALERGDVSRWPKGIYRKAFFRDYVSSLGLPTDPYVQEFIDLFPDSDAPQSPPPVATVAGPPGSLRLTFADGAVQAWTGHVARSAFRRTPRQILAAVVDVGLLLGLAFAAARWWAPEMFWPVLAVAGAVYSTVCTAVLGCSLSLALIEAAQTPVTQWAGRFELQPRVTVPVGESSPRLGELIGETLRGRSTVHEYLSRLSYTSTLGARGQRRRELSAARRRRAEAANRSSADEISAIG